MNHFNRATMKQYLSSVYFCDTFSVKTLCHVNDTFSVKTLCHVRHVLVLYMYEVFHSTHHPCRGVLCTETTKPIQGIMNNLQQSLMRCTACSAETKGQQ